MKWISNWIQGIIIAVIIGTIIEMILPEGNNKKYIKIVIGIYILYSIVSPAITKFAGDNFKLTNILEIDEYIQASSSNEYEDLNQNQDEQISTIYETNLKNDMKQKIEAKGYEVLQIVVDIDKKENYNLKQIMLKLKKATLQNENSNNDIKIVNEIKIDVNNEQSKNNLKKDSKEKLSQQEKNEIKKYLSTVYQIEEKNININ